MSNQALQMMVVVLMVSMLSAISATAAFAQAPNDGVYISDGDIQAVLKRAADMQRRIPDNTIRVIDMGQYQLGVAVVQRGPMRDTVIGAEGNNAAVRSAANASANCGEPQPGATGPTGISHDDTAETYVVISGGGMLITGGTIVNGRRSRPDDEVTTVLNGPSCSGTMVGYTSRGIKAGDVIVIPEGVPHGFSAIPDHITYLSIRPDLKKVLQHGYVNPALKQ